MSEPLSSTQLSLVGLINSTELSSIGELASQAERTIRARSVQLAQLAQLS
jgi:predicted transcriptional regulator